MSMHQYMKYLKSLKRMPLALEQHIQANVRPVNFPAGHMIQKEGEFCGHIYFIEKGIVRIFTTNRNIEKILRFKKENDFILAHFDNSTKIRSRSIQALEDMTAWDFTPEMIRTTCEDFLLFNQHLMNMMMKDIILMNETSDHFEDNDAAGLFHFLRQHSPDLLDRVDPKYLASFMGISERAFLHMKTSPIRLRMSGKHLRG